MVSSLDFQGTFDTTPALGAKSVLGLKQLPVAVTTSAFMMATRYPPSVEESLRNSKTLNPEEFEGQSRSVSCQKQ
jgi:hypothetical protein